MARACCASCWCCSGSTGLLHRLLGAWSAGAGPAQGTAALLVAQAGGKAAIRCVYAGGGEVRTQCWLPLLRLCTKICGQARCQQPSWWLKQEGKLPSGMCDGVGGVGVGGRRIRNRSCGFGLIDGRARCSSPSGGSSRKASCLQVGRLHHLCFLEATPSFLTGFEARHVVAVSTIGRSHLLQSPLLLPGALLVSLSSSLTLSKLRSHHWLLLLLLLPSYHCHTSSCRDA